MEAAATFPTQERQAMQVEQAPAGPQQAGPQHAPPGPWQRPGRDPWHDRAAPAAGHPELPAAGTPV
eukprot:4352443-Pyramimonas_sp.AAC.1